MGSISPRYRNVAFSALDRLQDAQTEGDLRLALSDAIAPFGGEHFLIASSRIQSSIFGKMIILEQWPKAWTQHYQRENLFLVDPVAKLARSHFDAFNWDVAAARDTSVVSRRVMEISSIDHHLRDGFCIPIHGTSGYQAMVSVAGLDLDLTREARRTVEMIAFFAYKTALKLKSISKTYILTPREREIITWAAAGKSAWATSEILRISEQTVKTHISSVMAKLEVCSKAQAVAESIRLGEICP